MRRRVQGQGAGIMGAEGGEGERMQHGGEWGAGATRQQWERKES